MKFAALIVLFLTLPIITQAEILNVPDDHETIQAGIDASEDGDTVLVQPGEYVENIRYLGKDIVVGSLLLTSGNEAYIDSTIIDGDQRGSVVEFSERVTSDAKLTGFTIQNGSGTSFGFGELMGGGIFILQSDVVIEHCRIRDNHVGDRFGEPFGGWTLHAPPIFPTASILGASGPLKANVLPQRDPHMLHWESSRR